MANESVERMRAERNKTRELCEQLLAKLNELGYIVRYTAEIAGYHITPARPNLEPKFGITSVDDVALIRRAYSEDTEDNPRDGYVIALCDSHEALRRRVHTAGDEMLERVRASLRDYPHSGGDIFVLKEVERIVAEAVSAAMEGQ